jgi:hypothetical protein
VVTIPVKLLEEVKDLRPLKISKIGLEHGP